MHCHNWCTEIVSVIYLCSRTVKEPALDILLWDTQPFRMIDEYYNDHELPWSHCLISAMGFGRERVRHKIRFSVYVSTLLGRLFGKRKAPFIVLQYWWPFSIGFRQHRNLNNVHVILTAIYTNTPVKPSGGAPVSGKYKEVFSHSVYMFLGILNPNLAPKVLWNNTDISYYVENPVYSLVKLFKFYIIIHAFAPKINLSWVSLFTFV